MLKYFLKSGSYIIILLIISCANPGTPTGGMKDEVPPIIVSSKPENGTTNFKEKKIEIRFDELIKFKDLKKQLVISPPMKNDPQIRPGGTASDRIKITILDTLSENTTYTINFGNSIQDNNEGNPYPNYRYVFSTGDYVDSLSLSGKIQDAFNEGYPENVMVVLYEVDSAYTDSVIYKELPRYVTNTIDSDTFRIDNLKAGKYMLFALEEKSSNLKYNALQDRMAFYPQEITIPDSNKYLLKIFGEEAPFSVKRPVHAGKGQVRFVFDSGADDLDISIIYPPKSDTVRNLLDFSKYRDTAIYWYSARESDSIQFFVKSPIHDIADTVTVTLKSQKDVESLFEVKNKSTLAPSNRLGVVSNYPIIDFNKDSIRVMSLVDSSEVYFEIEQTALKSLKFDFEPKYNEKYAIQLLPGAVTNFFNVVNDTIIETSSVKKKSAFGEIIFNINNIETYPVIVELVQGKDAKIIRRKISTKKEEYSFPDLKPGKYKLRIIIDENANGKWDPGSFLLKKLPEEVKYFSEEIELKANWDIQQTWNLAN